MSANLPNSWALVPLSEVALINPPNPDAVPFDTAIVSFVPMSAVDAVMTAADTSLLRPWSEVREGYKRFQNGDLIVAKITPCMENGKLALLTNLHGGVGAGSTEFHVIRPSAAVCGGLLRYFFAQESVRRSARSQMTGTAGQLRVPASFVQSVALPLPPLGEQRRLVECLAAYTTRLDVAEQTLLRARKNLARHRASVLRSAVEGRLVPTEASRARAEGRDYEPASELLERILADRRERWEGTGKRRKYAEPQRPDTAGKPQLPEGWCWATLDQLLIHLTSGSRDWSDFYGRGSSVFIMAQNVRPGRFDPSFVQYIDPPIGDPSRARSEVMRGDLLVTIVGANTGSVCRVATDLKSHFVCQSVALMRPVEPGVSSYLDLFLNSPLGSAQFDRYMYGQGRPHLSFEQLRSTVVALPPLGEQARIQAEAERLLSVGETSETTCSRSGRLLSKLRQAVLNWGFQGRLVDQDPADEPASLLINGIRADRTNSAPSSSRRRT